MKSQYHLELDNEASIQANLDFLDKCMKDIQLKKRRLKYRLKKKAVNNQIDLYDQIADTTT